MTKRLFRIAIVLVVLVLIALGIAFFFLGNITKRGVETVGPVLTKAPVTLASATISIFGGSGELKGFVLGNPEGFKTPQAMKVDSIALGVVPSSVLSDKIVVRHIRVQAPEITYEAKLKGSNIGQILENLQAAAKGDTPATNQAPQASRALQVDEFVVTGGKITVSATALGGAGATLALPELRLSNLGQGPEGITVAELSSKAFALIVEATAKVVMENAANLGKDVTESAKKAGSDAAERLKQGASGITDLLKSKKE